MRSWTLAAGAAGVGEVEVRVLRLVGGGPSPAWSCCW